MGSYGSQSNEVISERPRKSKNVHCNSVHVHHPSPDLIFSTPIIIMRGNELWTAWRKNASLHYDRWYFQKIMCPFRANNNDWISDRFSAAMYLWVGRSAIQHIDGTKQLFNWVQFGAWCFVRFRQIFQHLEFLPLGYDPVGFPCAFSLTKRLLCSACRSLAEERSNQKSAWWHQIAVNFAKSNPNVVLGPWRMNPV